MILFNGLIGEWLDLRGSLFFLEILFADLSDLTKTTVWVLVHGVQTSSLDFE